MDGEGAGAAPYARLDDDPPLIAGHIHGVRTWSLMWTPDGGLALAGYVGCMWEPGGRVTVAECGDDAARACRHAPGPQCACGLYGRHPFTREARCLQFGPPDPADELSPFSDFDVAGVVEAWGRVELHEGGFRAQYARPLALVVVDGWRDSEYGALVRRLAERYRAELICLREAQELMAWCDERRLGLSKPTVKSLLRERPRPAPPRAEPGQQPVGDRGRAGWLAELWEEWRPGGIGEALGLLFGGAMMLVYAAFWVVIAYTIAAAIFGWFPEDDRPRGGERSALHGKRSLEVLDEEVVRDGKRRWLYLATVKNTGDRTAIGVVPSGRLLDRDGERVASIDRPNGVEGAANLAPGQTGVVWDVIRPRTAARRAPSDAARMKVGIGARRLVAGPARSPVEVRRVRTDHDRCIVTATIDARRPMPRAQMALVGRDAKGRALGAGTADVGPVSKGRARYVVARIPPRACGHPELRLDAHPSLTRRQLLGRQKPGSIGATR